jgi:hypothetical protein
MKPQIVLTAPATIRRCIYCGLPITFGWLELPIAASRRDPRPVAVFFTHPTPEACAAERDRRAPDADPHDIGVQRARLLDDLVARLHGAPTSPDADPAQPRRRVRARQLRLLPPQVEDGDYATS